MKLRQKYSSVDVLLNEAQSWRVDAESQNVWEIHFGNAFLLRLKKTNNVEICGVSSELGVTIIADILLEIASSDS